MRNKELSTNNCKSYPLLDNKIPGLPTQSIAYEELNEIKWDVEDDVVKPDHTGPTPPNPFNCSKTPVCINGNQSSNLLTRKIKNYQCFFFFQTYWLELIIKWRTN